MDKGAHNRKVGYDNEKKLLLDIGSKAHSCNF